MSTGLLNHMMQAINRNQQNIGYVQLGIITSVNPKNSSIKAQIQPDNYETGFIPYLTPWIGWYAPPTSGQQVVVLYQEGSKNVPIGAMVVYTPSMLPPAGLVSGEAILHHSSGSSIKLSNSGDITVNGTTNVNITCPHTTINNGGTAEFLAKYQELKTAFDNHIHMVGSDPTTAPTVPLPTTVSTTTLKAE